MRGLGNWEKVRDGENGPEEELLPTEPAILRPMEHQLLRRRHAPTTAQVQGQTSMHVISHPILYSRML